MMKKPAIMIIVGVLAVILFLQYQQRKSAPSDIAPQAPQAADVISAGVALPPESAIDTAMPPPAVARPPQFTQPPAKPMFTPPSAMAGKGAIPAIQADFAKQPICPNGKTLNDILTSHGKVWGSMALNPTAFTKPENDTIYGLLSKFFSCQVLVYGDMEMCNYVPGVQHRLDKYFSTPNYKCVDPSTKVLFYASATGRVKSEAPCRKYLDGDNLTGAKAKLPPDFCKGVVEEGFAALCNNPKAGSNRGAKCREAFPSSRDDCKSEGSLENFSLYSAIKDNNLSGCPTKYMTECNAFFTKSQSACAPILANLGAVYCQALTAHDSSNSPEAQRARAEEKKKLEQKIMEEVNKKARKALGKE